MWTNLRKWLPAVVVVLLILVIFLVVRPLVETHQGSDGGKTASTSTPSPAKGTAQPTPSPDALTGPEDSSPPIPTCNQEWSVGDYAQFVTTLEKYEGLFQQQAPSDSFKGMATTTYIANHHAEIAEDQGGIEVVVDPAKTVVTCTILSGTEILAVIQPTITVYQTGGNDRTLLNGPFLSNSHATRWVRQGGKWLIDSEY
ncbi:MAG: hypothetical protein JWO99_234 [Candidatus Saccharibacteria bacterium]|nr:hypothetical protein [Candidatus Saccharibacteria bacterium]